jgi:metallo-beta-lactamase family protein
VRVFGEEVEVRCGVETIGGYSAHADRHELRDWVRRLGGPVRRAFVVHGEDEGLRAMATILGEEGIGTVHIPARGQSFELEGA